jgi:transposase-like protein
MEKQKSSVRYAPEVRARAVRMVLQQAGDHASQWEAISSIAAKIDCTAETLRKWVRRAERDHGVARQSGKAATIWMRIQVSRRGYDCREEIVAQEAILPGAAWAAVGARQGDAQKLKSIIELSQARLTPVISRSFRLDRPCSTLSAALGGHR